MRRRVFNISRVANASFQLSVLYEVQKFWHLSVVCHVIRLSKFVLFFIFRKYSSLGRHPRKRNNLQFVFKTDRVCASSKWLNWDLTLKNRSSKNNNNNNNKNLKQNNENNNKTATLGKNFAAV